MNKAILKKFAIESRQELMEKMKNKINTFYIDEEFNKEQRGDLFVLSNNKHSLALSKEEYDKRESLINRIKELTLEQVIEESAYTWFNRIIAIRYMEIHDYLPLTKDNQSLGFRVLSSKDNTPDPEILKFTNLSNPELDIGFKKEKYVELKDDNEKFKYILLLVCKKLGKVIPQVFDGITDYIDILIPDNLLNDSGFVTKVLNDVPEDNYNEVEILGWLYQYYISEKKDKVFSDLKRNIKIGKNSISSATQIFTPDWIVKYMVENSLGRFWLEHGGNKELINNWKYYISNEKMELSSSIDPKEIKCIDPCSGSGHILVYLFEVLYQIYLSYGYSKKEIAQTILENNLFGLDIDDRACQLSVLSVLLKSREYDKDIFNKSLNINILGIDESNKIDKKLLSLSGDNDNTLEYLIEQFFDAKGIGSLIKVDDRDYDEFENKLLESTIYNYVENKHLQSIVKVAKILKNKYSIVVTNPPYMGINGVEKKLADYFKKNYANSKSDLCTMMMDRAIEMTIDDGYISMINMPVWMFISSFEDFRLKLLNKVYISSLLHFGRGVFGSDFGSVAFVIKNTEPIDKEGMYFKLFKKQGEVDSLEEKERMFLQRNKEYHYKQINFFQIPGQPIAYWVGENTRSAFSSYKRLEQVSEPKQGIATANNDKYLRYWFEIDINNFERNASTEQDAIVSNKKWYPYSKGGEYRKWYGNNEYVINWYHNGKEIKEDKKAVVRNSKYHLREGITWTWISISFFGARFQNSGFVFDVAGSMLFSDLNYNYLICYLCSKVADYFLKIINPTINFSNGVISKLPIKYEESKEIMEIGKENIQISKEDWDAFENSWDFQNNPLISESNNNCLIKECYYKWNNKKEYNFERLKNNEIILNEYFIELFNLQNEIRIDIDDSDITIRKADLLRDIKCLISYAVGCMFGRYSLDKEGLVFAGGEFNKNNYKTFNADEDNIIPITDEAYFGDDIVARFKQFIEVAFGKDTLNQNIDFIAETLGRKGTETSEDTIRRYFLNDFFSDHVKMYQKRPIYWLFDSGKKNGFKVLIYMHRYNENLIPKVRLDYLHKIQTTYEKLLTDVNDRLKQDLSTQEKREAQAKQADLNAKLNEIKEYDEKIAHIANMKKEDLKIDLDDGVRENYKKFRDILANSKDIIGKEKDK